MSENKHHKRREIDHTDDTIDCISNLPDCILHHILSFLPTVAVIHTSILSKRWKNLWTSVPSLDLDDSIIYASEMNFPCLPELMTSFLNFEERILRSRDAPQMEKFHLSCHECFPSRVSSWISNAVLHNVREVYLCLYSGHPSTIPRCIFDCKTLVILSILIFSDIELPSHIYLPRLKILDLSLVGFTDNESTQKLFSSCPVLEELVLCSCAFETLSNITISILTLKKLTMKERTDYDIIYSSGCKIKIDAKNLTYLEYNGHLTNEIFLNNVSSLVKACIDIPILHQSEKEVACRAVDLLKGLQNVECLSVSNCTMESIIYADKMNLFPVFPNLTHLVLTMEINTFRTFMYLLNFCPTLQSISFSEGFNGGMLLGENDSIWLSVPICISHHLKTLSFNNFHANYSEIRFLKFVLKYACVLEKMDVWWCKPKPPDLKKQRDVKKEFEITKKRSAACIINFS